MFEFNKEEILEYGNGKRKKRVIFIREATGIDRRKEAVLRVLGPGWICVDDEEDNKK